MQNKSFTLIELLVVIVIIGILAGVIIVSVSSSINKANFAKAQSFSNTVQNELLGDLVSEWTFNSPAVSGKTEDSWGNNDGTLVGANGLPQLQSKENCVYGTCYSFDGVDDYILSTYGKLIPNQNIYTITGWFNIPSTAIGVSNRILVALSEGSFPRFSPCFWTQYKPIIYLSSSNFKYGTSDLRDDKWHHVVFVVTGSNNEDINNAKIYVDGIEEKYSTPLSSTAPTVPNGNFTIGKGFIGKLDDVRVYDSTLSSSKIKQEYIAGLNSLLANNNISKEEYNLQIESLASK